LRLAGDGGNVEPAFLGVHQPMILRTLVRDCLFLNWAVPAELLPPPPEPLRYEIHRAGTRSYVLVSALLFRQVGLRLARLPVARLSYPQCNVRAYVVDGEGLPAVWFWRELMPLWVVPGARLLGRQPARAARFAYPEPIAPGAVGPWRWDVRTGGAAGRLLARAEPGSPAAPADGPVFPAWDALVEHLRQRPRGYALSPLGLERVSTSHPSVPVWPLRATVEDDSLVRAAVPGATPTSWPALHSAWLCPELPFLFEVVSLPEVAVPSQVPAAG